MGPQLTESRNWSLVYPQPLMCVLSKESHRHGCHRRVVVERERRARVRISLLDVDHQTN